jgi:hypothetical protein
LKAKYTETVKAAEAQIRLWRIIAITEAVAIVGIVVYVFVAR